jgi:hypothetical protein
MPPKNKPMKPVPKSRMGYAEAAWDESMKRAKNPMGSGKYNPATYVVAGTLAAGAAATKKDPFAKPLKPTKKKGK